MKCILIAGGILSSLTMGPAKEGKAVEIMGILDHSCSPGIRHDPEFRSKPCRPRPLSAGIVAAVHSHEPRRASGERVDRPITTRVSACSRQTV